MKKLTKIFVVGLASLSLVGCGKVAKLKNGEDAVLTIKNGGISADELYSELKENYGAGALINMVDKLILSDKYKETDDEKEYIDEQISKLKTQAESSNVDYNAYVKNYYGSEDKLKELLTLSYRRDLAVKDYLKGTIKDKEIENYYEDNIYGDIRAKHILIESKALSGMTSEEVSKLYEEALSKAKDIIKKLDDGEDFDELAKEYSADKSNNSKGGDLGWFNTGEMDDAFEDVAFSLKKGEYTKEPVKTSYGYHIILKTDEKDKPKLADVKNTIIDTLVKEKLNNESTLYYETLEKIREDYELKFSDDALKKSFNEYLKNLKNQ